MISRDMGMVLKEPLFPRGALHRAALAEAGARTGDAGLWCVAFSGGADSLALLLAVAGLWPERRGRLVALHFNHRLRGEASDGDERFCREVCAALGVAFRAGRWEDTPVMGKIPNPKVQIPKESQNSKVQNFKIPPSSAPGLSPTVPPARVSEARVSEARAREERHAFFRREMDALGARVLWLGHQKDDVAETQLMRLARGSSSAGLAAPRPAQRLADGRVFLRPLLALTKAEITAALRARGVAWREDATNAGGDFFRNRIRRDVLPAWLAAAPGDALAGAALSREWLEEDDEALEAWLGELMECGARSAERGMDRRADGIAFAGENGGAGENRSADIPVRDFAGRNAHAPLGVAAANTDGTPVPPLDLRVLAGKPRALWRRALRRWEPAGGLARAGFEALLELCMRGGDFQRVSVGGGFAVMRGGVLAFLAADAGDASALPGGGAVGRWLAGASASLPARAGCVLFLPDGAVLAAREVAISPGLRARILAGDWDPAREVCVSLEEAAPPLVARPWAPGDRYRPLGAPGSAKLHDLFINRKIPAGRRLALPVVCDARGRIVWVPGLPPADEVKISNNSGVGLRLTYKSGTSTVRP
ncbi:MAG: tRNA lysidine(34) synthetase TilS [Opitutaceae bacterium]|jgi:tRNA(Ile)-lysidine synthase|nr:tRNA lysidine(34) synthetase TilS [Opitutaceae bacterium]